MILNKLEKRTEVIILVDERRKVHRNYGGLIEFKDGERIEIAEIGGAFESGKFVVKDRGGSMRVGAEGDYFTRFYELRRVE
ncbi:MAG: hypothetical protein ABIF88_03935 [archaeon]